MYLTSGPRSTGLIRLHNDGENKTFHGCRDVLNLLGVCVNSLWKYRTIEVYPIVEYLIGIGGVEV